MRVVGVTALSPRSRIRCQNIRAQPQPIADQGSTAQRSEGGDATEVIGSGEHVIAERVGAAHKLREALSGWQFPDIDSELHVRAPNRRGPAP
jgi:hypothetical protein